MKKSPLILAAFGAAGLLLSGAAVTLPQHMAQSGVKRMHGGPKQQLAPAVASTPAHAWVVRDRGNIPLGLVSLNLQRPQMLTPIAAIKDKAFAGAMTPQGYFFYRFHDDAANSTMDPIALSKVDPKTGKVTDIADWSKKAFIFNDMAYDWKHGVLYGLSREFYTDDFLTALQFEYSGLYAIDMATGVATQVKQFIDWPSGAINNPTYLTLTADLDGNLYVVNNGGTLLRIDPENEFEATEIGSTGRTPAARLQTMDYDPMSGMIFWAADYSNLLSDICVIDPTTAATSQVGFLGTDSRLAGLSVDFNIPSAGAPAGVSALKAVTDASGAPKATVSFVNPDRTFGGSVLTSISELQLMRDGELANSWTAPEAGAALNFVDNVEQPGYVTYSVLPKNILGDGLVRNVTIWVGRDVPEAPGNVGIGCNSDGSAIIQWDAPKEGLHGGWLDMQSLKYAVIRMPGNVRVANDLTDCEYTDRSITTMSKYSYIVVPYTADGQGETAQSVEIALGSSIGEFPYNCQFNDQSEFDTWSVLNPNGGSTWSWKKRGLADFEGFAMYQYDNKLDGDDYLVSPAIEMKPEGTYTLRFNYRGSNANYEETMDVRFGNAPTVEALTQNIKDIKMKSGDGQYAEVTLPKVEKAGTYHVAFHATSPKGRYNIYVTDVTIDATGVTPDIPVAEHPAPANLQAEVQGNDVTLTWDTPDTPANPVNPGGTKSAIIEDFESYPNWVIHPKGKYEWSYIDGDGGKPYRNDYADMPFPTDGTPCAAKIIAPYELSQTEYKANPPHSGERILLFESNFADADGNRPAPKPDDWLISPALDFDEDFVFSFWCKADPDLGGVQEGYTGDDIWNKENFQVGYSKTGKAKEDFVWLSDELETVQTTGSSWTAKEYAIPKDAKYVCIHYCTPENGFWFMVDDIYIGPAAGRPAMLPRKADGETASVLHYEIHLDGVNVAETTLTSHTLRELADGNHRAAVVAVYADGKSEAVEVPFSVGAGSGVDTIVADGLYRLYDLQGNRVTEPKQGEVYIRVDSNGSSKITYQK